MKDLIDFRDFSKIQVSFYVDESVFVFCLEAKKMNVSFTLIHVLSSAYPPMHLIESIAICH